MSSFYLQLKQVFESDRANNKATVTTQIASMCDARPIRLRECFCATFGCIRLHKLFATYANKHKTLCFESAGSSCQKLKAFDKNMMVEKSIKSGLSG